MAIRRILEDYRKGRISLEEAEKKVRIFNLVKLSEWGNLDVHRESRTGAPEVVFGEGKNTKELIKLVSEFVERNGRCIVTRLSPVTIRTLNKNRPKKTKFIKNEKAGMVVVRARDYKLENTGGKVAIMCAGTSDIPKAEEARMIVEEMGCKAYTFYDIGVAGLHRLMPAVKKIVEEDVDVAIVAAGMEGALPSVVAGLVDIPVVGLPISTGYGARGKGETALFAMLQSCSPGIGVVNIDNGLGAGILASTIANRIAKFRL